MTPLNLALRTAAPASVSPTPSPSPSPSDTGIVEQGFDATVEAGNAFWEWFTGWPLQILVILVIGGVILALLRRVIGHVTERIATGAGTKTTEPPKDASASSGAWRRYLGRTPFVEDAIALANPLASQRRAQRARTVGSVLRSTANITVGTIMALMILQAVGQPVGALLASAGVVGIALGFGAQSLVKDFISGVFLLVEDQFGVGDVVDLGSGATGTVEEVQLRVTQVRAFDGTLWYVRNGEILRAGNMTQQWSRAVAEVRVPIDADVDVVRAALGRAADAVQADPELSPLLLEAPSVRGVDAVNDITMTFTLHAQTRPGDQWEVSRELRRLAQAELRRSGVLLQQDDVEPALLEEPEV
ncbi:mechanosensitive ion channel family protein [Krasilnikoviella flava]|uniref:Small conductance mechanosensitive channel n=1 Tax=Krasilnikoviella flava TaxID=526729 RepID=A0A1T5LQ72_9MICO|nr:mechanosensitive ion channel family protein [Krasilnikoviella flava]SKC78100.1 small conductance mechanosensitive channel [Krasilnikoviella flava]